MHFVHLLLKCRGTNCCQVFSLMLLAKKMNFVDDFGCVTSRDNEHKRNIHLPSATCTCITGMFSVPQKLLYCLTYYFVFCSQRKIEQVKISCPFWRNRYVKNIEKYVSYYTSGCSRKKRSLQNRLWVAKRIYFCIPVLNVNLNSSQIDELGNWCLKS